ncbi:hypothetical protein LJR029_004565 [Caballeronia sp. LjRoot29]|uniref:hypothetical protein n=1 Tax=Caballeronia sp. LjRoot29 TaxID=3342315 RepID=UPI003ECCD5CD
MPPRSCRSGKTEAIPEPHLREKIKKLAAAPLTTGEDAGRIGTMPAGFPAYDLNHLLAGIPPFNLHAEVCFGPAVGAEVF